jgi:autotransporter-associated beta strand protein
MRRMARFERLERRDMLTSTSWLGGSGLWDQAANWSNGVPSSTVDANISPASAATITIQPGETVAAQNLTLGSNAALSLPGGGDPSNPTYNLITTNSGFESPTASGSTTRPSTWGYWGSSYLSTQYAYSGKQSIAVSGSNSGVDQSFSVSPGASYTASVYAMTPAANRLTGTIYANLQLLFYDASNNLLSSYSAPNQVTVLSGSSATGGPLTGSVGSDGWNHFFTTAVAPTGAASARIQLSTYSTGTNGGAVYYDAPQFGPAAVGASTLNVTSISNSGTITIGPTNTVNVSGGFTQTSTGTLDIQLGGAQSTGSYGSMTITGAAALGGTLKAELVYSYAPSTTDSFTPVTFASETGGFSATTMPNGSGYQFAGAASFTDVLISAAPSAATTTTVNVGTKLHAVATSLMGINMAWWDSAAVTSQTQQMATAAGLNLYRFPGGSSSDEYHFTTKNNFNDSVAITVPQFAQFITSAGGTGLITLDYGSGSPQEAAAELAYLLGSPSDTTTIGSGLQWNTTTSQWQSVDWKTAGYWASLRAASPLGTDDGLNFLRIAHAAPFSAIKYWEVGNEEYGVSWEIDHHGTTGPGGVSTGTAHDPATYVAFAKQFAALVAPILATAGLPAVSIGIDSGDPGAGGWTQNVLSNGLANSFVPNFISDHSYMQGPGSESDSFLLNQTVSNANSNLDWVTRYGLYQTMLQQTLGSQASGVALMATEFNSVYTNPGKQSTSLVNGLFIANSLGSLLASGYSGSSMWDLRNGWDTTKNNSNLLYGWREGGDYGAIGPSGQNDPPFANTYIAYPNYFAVQLLSKIIVTGGQVVSAASSYSDLDVYAVREANGDLDLLVINTNPAAAITNQFNVSGFQATGAAQVWQYGKAEDLAQSLTTNGSAALTHTSATLALSGANFSYTFPAYSMTVLDLTGSQTLTSVAVSLAANHLATTGVEQFTATAYDQFGNPMVNQPTFTWSVVGTGLIDSSGDYQPPYTSGSAIVKATSGSVPGQTTVTFPGAAEWNSTGSGSWTDGSWIGSVSTTAVSPPGLRGVPGDTAVFGSSGGTISLNGASPSLAGITFAGSGVYTLAVGSGGMLTLNNGASPTTIVVTSGNPTIAVPVTLASTPTIAPAAGDTLTISGGVSGGNSLTLNGPGKLVLGGSNSFGGGASVVSGTLVVSNATALPSGSNLSIGANAGQAFAPIVAAAPIAAPITQSTATAAPAITKDIRGKALLAVVRQLAPRNRAWYAASRFWFAPVSESQQKDAAQGAWDAALAKYGSV